MIFITTLSKFPNLDELWGEASSEADPVDGGDEAVSGHRAEDERAQLLPLLAEVMRVDLSEKDGQDHGQDRHQVHLPPVLQGHEGQRLNHTIHIVRNTHSPPGSQWHVNTSLQLRTFHTKWVSVPSTGFCRVPGGLRTYYHIHECIQTKTFQTNKNIINALKVEITVLCTTHCDCMFWVLDCWPCSVSAYEWGCNTEKPTNIWWENI